MNAVFRRLGAIALVAVLSACGGGGSGADATASAAGSTTAPVTSTAGPATTGPATPGSGPVGSTATTGPSPAAPAIPAAQPSPALAAAANVLPVVLDGGTDGAAMNMPLVTVTVCEPGTSNCQQVDHVLVDTGSYGLRLAASALPFTGGLTQVSTSPGTALAECAGFVSGWAWGPVRRADVQMAGERAANIPVHVVDDPAYAAVPVACSNTGARMGVGSSVKGILGVGFQAQDCGASCVNSAAPAIYFACSGSVCNATAVPLASQVVNPVARFAADNNGVALVLPDIGLGGVPSVSGALVFGVGTQDNNQVGSRQIYTANAQGNFTTTYKGRSVSSFIDSGSNGIFFRDATLPCGSGFFCPSSVLTLGATVTGANAASHAISFQVENPSWLASGSAAGHLAGSMGLGRDFDWGLPFFFGRTVFVAMQGASTPAGSGPFWAF